VGLRFDVTASPLAADEKAARGLVALLQAAGHDAALKNRQVRWPVRRLSRGAFSIYVGNPDARYDAAVLLTPGPDSLAACRRRFPNMRLVVPHVEMVPAEADGMDAVTVLPLPLPPAIADPERRARAAFAVAREFRLENRPRIVYAGPMDGPGMTRALHLAGHALPPGDGELVLVGGQAQRTALAPAVHNLRLSEVVVFLPPLDDDDYGGLIAGADVLIAPGLPAEYPIELLWAAAVGLPMVALDHPLYRLASGDAALLVQPHRDDAWPAAVTEALNAGRRREKMMALGLRHAAPHQDSESLRANWITALMGP
jgi:glycosyltransferase involved in cell wall biosynthesis